MPTRRIELVYDSPLVLDPRQSTHRSMLQCPHLQRQHIQLRWRWRSLQRSPSWSIEESRRGRSILRRGSRETSSRDYTSRHLRSLAMERRQERNDKILPLRSCCLGEVRIRQPQSLAQQTLGSHNRARSIRHSSRRYSFRLNKQQRAR